VVRPMALAGLDEASLAGPSQLRVVEQGASAAPGDSTQRAMGLCRGRLRWRPSAAADPAMSQQMPWDGCRGQAAWPNGRWCN